MENIIGYGTIAALGLSRAPFQTVRRWWRERRMADELHALDDAILMDIGVYRGDIPSIVRARCAERGW